MDGHDTRCGVLTLFCIALALLVDNSYCPALISGKCLRRVIAHTVQKLVKSLCTTFNF